MKAKIFVFITILTLLFNFPSIKSADTGSEWTYLNDVVDQAYQFTKHHEYDKALRLMDHFSRQYTMTTATQSEESKNQYFVLTESFTNALEAVRASDMSHEERVQKMLQFRLAVDALSSKYQPLWAELEPKVIGAFEDMKTTLEAEEMQEFPLKFNYFLQQYQVIYPSLVIDLNSDQLEQLNAYITYLEGYKINNPREQQLQLESMERDLVSLFRGVHMDETDPMFIWVLLSMGSIIFITLTYVAWRKYLGDRSFWKPRQT